MIRQHDITIFNKIIDPVTFEEIFQHKNLKGLFDSTRGSNLIKSGTSGLDSLSVYINFDEISTFKEPKEFQNNHTGFWTISSGDKIVKGIIKKDYLSSSEIDKLENSFTIVTFDMKDFGSLKHFEVMAK